MPSLGLGLGTHIPNRVLSRLLLDQFSGAAAAYSLQKLSASTTNVVRVRRSSDNAERDFTATEVADGTLTTWVGANDGFVRTWYDQSGNARNGEQTMTTAQPQIVSSGSLVSGGIDFTQASGQYLQVTGTNSETLHAFIVGAARTTSPEFGHFFDASPLGSGGTSQYFSIYTALTNGQYDFRIRDNVGVNDLTLSASDNQEHLFVARFNGSSNTQGFAIDGGSETTQTTVNRSTSNLWGIGSSNSIFSGRSLDGTVNELIVYASDESDKAAGIKSNINERYSIY